MHCKVPILRNHIFHKENWWVDPQDATLWGVERFSVVERDKDESHQSRKTYHKCQETDGEAHSTVGYHPLEESHQLEKYRNDHGDGCA